MTHILSTETGARLAVISCAIRNAGTGWQLIDDAAHAPSGVTAVIQRADHLELTHVVGAVKVSSVQVSVDEYYAARAVRCGPSVGLNLTRIYLYTGTSTVPVNPAALASPSGNLWVTGLLEVA